MTMELDQQTKDSIKLRLRSIGMAELLPRVEKLMLGQAAPVDAIQLLNSAYQLGWMEGQQFQIKVTNELLSGIAYGGNSNGK